MPGGISMNFTDKEKQRFSLRKLSIGVCSVLLGTTIYMANTEVAQADSPVNANESQSTKIQSQTPNNQPGSQLVLAKASGAQNQLGG